MQIVASSVIFDGGHGGIHYRIILAKWRGEYVVWNQWMNEKGGKTSTSWGEYYLQDIETANSEFLARCARQGPPLTGQELDNALKAFMDDEIFKLTEARELASSAFRSAVS